MNSDTEPDSTGTPSSIRSGLEQQSSTAAVDWYNGSPPYFLAPASSLSFPLVITRPNDSDPPTSLIVPSLHSSSSSSSHSATLQSLPGSASHTVSMSYPHQPQSILSARSRSRSRDDDSSAWSPLVSPATRGKPSSRCPKKKKCKSKEDVQNAICLDLAKDALKVNDSMVYLEGPTIYTCSECRTHLTSHDEIISKSFHGRHGRAYLFDQCVNINIGPAEDRRLITGLHSVCDIFCKRCRTLIGWTYARAYEPSQRYKEGKFIIEKINLHMEESDYYQVTHPAGERRDKWKIRSMSWSDDSYSHSPRYRQDDETTSTVYEYRTRARSTSSVSWTSTREGPATMK